MLRTAAIVCLLALPALADPEGIQIPVHHLKLKPGLEESARGLMDVFPYVAGEQGRLRTDTLPAFLAEEITSEDAAIEAVRLFAAGPLVRDERVAKSLIEEGKLQAKTLKQLRVAVNDHRPGSYAPSAKKEKDAWRVSLVAFECDRMLRLVHIEAVVEKNGTVTLERKPIVDGPMTSWQTAAIADGSSDDVIEAVDAAKREQEMRAEALRARKAYAKALAPTCDLDTAWALARLRLTSVQLTDLWGPPDRVVGSGLYLVARDLKDGSAVFYDSTDKRAPVRTFRQVRDAKGPGSIGPVLRVLARE